MTGLQRTVLDCRSLVSPFSRLQQSGKVGVLVSIILILTLFLCSYFCRFIVRL